MENIRTTMYAHTISYTQDVCLNCTVSKQL